MTCIHDISLWKLIALMRKKGFIADNKTICADFYTYDFHTHEDYADHYWYKVFMVFCDEKVVRFDSGTDMVWTYSDVKRRLDYKYTSKEEGRIVEVTREQVAKNWDRHARSRKDLWSASGYLRHLVMDLPK